MRTFICLGKVDVTKFWWPLCAKVVCFSSNPSRGGNKIICFIWSQINPALGVRSQRVDVLIITRHKTALNSWPNARTNSTTYACIALWFVHWCMHASKSPLPLLVSLSLKQSWAVHRLTQQIQRQLQGGIKLWRLTLSRRAPTRQSG